MKDVPLKLRLLWQPFLLVAAGSVAFYSLVHWLYQLSGQELLTEEVVQFFIPMGLSAIPIYIWLYPRFKLVKPRKEKDQTFNLALIAWIAIAGPMIIAQMYIDKAVGTLTKIDNTAEINTQPKSKYYELKNCYFNKEYAGFHGTMEVSGRYNSDLNFKIYTTLPIFKDINDTAKANAVWLGRVYSKTVSNSGSDDEKDKKYDEFRKEVVADFDTRDFRRFTYLIRSPKSDARNNFIKAIERSGKSHPENLTILTAETDPFEQRTGSYLKWIFIAFAIGASVMGAFLLFNELDKEKVQLYEDGKPTEAPDEDGSAWMFFIPKEKFFITPILIDINIAVYLLMVIYGLGIVSIGGDDLLKWGADYRPLTTGGQWWRLVTSMFLHGGLMHIVGNMFGLFFVGLYLEPVLGKAKYLFAYMVTGIVGSITSIWWHVATVSVGASGAIFGLFGVFLSLLLLKVFPEEVKKQMLITTLVLVGYNLVFGLTGGIDNAAHMGGLVSGLLIGLIFSFSLDKHQQPADEQPDSVSEQPEA